jgi:hypothetical protein
MMAEGGPSEAARSRSEASMEAELRSGSHSSHSEATPKASLIFDPAEEKSLDRSDED